MFLKCSSPCGLVCKSDSFLSHSRVRFAALFPGISGPSSSSGWLLSLLLKYSSHPALSTGFLLLLKLSSVVPAVCSSPHHKFSSPFFDDSLILFGGVHLVCQFGVCFDWFDHLCRRLIVVRFWSLQSSCSCCQSLSTAVLFHRSQTK